MKIAICDCEIALEDFKRETNKGGANTATAISDCDIASEGVRMHRRRVNWIRGRFMRSDEGSMHRREITWDLYNKVKS